MDIFNSSHCADPTPKEAVEGIKAKKKKDEQMRRAIDTIRCVLRVFSLAGYEVVTDFTIRCRANGALYKAKANAGENYKKKE